MKLKATELTANTAVSEPVAGFAFAETGGTTDMVVRLLDTNAAGALLMPVHVAAGGSLVAVLPNSLEATPVYFEVTGGTFEGTVLTRVGPGS